jgi:hypothetical protein
MSLLCTFENCRKLVEWECVCEGKNRFCRSHYATHAIDSDCERRANVAATIKADFTTASELIIELNSMEREALALGKQLITETKVKIRYFFKEISRRKAKVLSWIKGNERNTDDLIGDIKKLKPLKIADELMNAIASISNLNNIISSATICKTEIIKEPNIIFESKE